MISYKRIVLLAALGTGLIFLWGTPFMAPFKIFVVYLHEISHGIGALLTGGEIQSISVGYDESGYTTAIGGSFLVMAISGYIGSVLFGSLMLYSGLKNHFTRLMCVAVGCILLFFTLMYPDKIWIIILGVSWGLAFIIGGFIDGSFARSILFFMGGLTSLYGFYDLGDFFRGNVSSTDAGLLAHKYLGGTVFETLAAYAIALFISAISVLIMIRIIRSALHEPSLPSEEILLEEDMDFPPLDKPIKEMTADEFLTLMKRAKDTNSPTEL